MSRLRIPVLIAMLLASPAALAGGTLKVQSDVAGQTVYLDGVDIGSDTPATINGVPTGTHVVTVVGGCRLGEATIELKDGATLPLSIRTVPTPGSLSLQVTPSDADVRLDGEVVASRPGEPVEIACGQHTLGVSKSGFLPMLLTLDVEAGQDINLPVSLTPQGQATLTLDVTPDNAAVELDGASLGAGDMQSLVVVAGAHIVRVTADGYVPAEKQIIVADGEVLDLAMPLVAAATALAAAPPVPPGAAPVQVEPVRRSASATRVTGVSLTAVGVGVGVLAGVQLARMGAMGAEYKSRADEVLATDDASILPAAYANDYRTDELLPQRNRALTSTVLAGALLATGVTLTVAF